MDTLFAQYQQHSTTNLDHLDFDNIWTFIDGGRDVPTCTQLANGWFG